MKIIKLLAVALGFSIAVTAAAASLNALSEHEKTNDSVAVMAGSDGDSNIKDLNKTANSIHSLIKEVILSLPAKVSSPILSVLSLVYEGSTHVTNLVLSFISRS